MARKGYKTKTLTLPDGTRKYIYGKTKQEVERKYNEAKLKMNAGVDLKNHDTFGEFAQMWFNTFKKGTVTKATEDQVKRNLNLHVMPHLSRYRMSQITPMMCGNIFAAMTGKSKALQTKVYNTLNEIFRTAEENGVIYKSPMTSTVKPGGAEAKEKHALTEIESKRLLKAVRGQDIEPLIRVGLETGLRRGELLGLQWSDVDLTRREIHVRHELRWENNNTPVIQDSLKSAAAYRKVPLPIGAYRALTRLWVQRDGDCVFQIEGKPLTYSQFRTQWKATQKAHISGLTPHILRHTCITNWIAAGLDVKEVQYLAGHSSSALTLDVYTDYLQSQRYEETRRKIQKTEKAPAEAGA